MTSLPGVLTAIAGLVSAATGGVALYLGQDDKPTGDTYIINEGAPVPDEQGQVDLPDLQSEQPEGSGDAFTDAVNGCLNGDAADCDYLLYLLADACYVGDLIGCDDLYLISAVGSDYEHYGATCGGRFYDWSYAGACSAAPL